MKHYTLITWPESQGLMEQDGFEDNAHPVYDEKGLEMFGPNAFMVNTAWLEETKGCVIKENARVSESELFEEALEKKGLLEEWNRQGRMGRIGWTDGKSISVFVHESHEDGYTEFRYPPMDVLSANADFRKKALEEFSGNEDMDFVGRLYIWYKTGNGCPLDPVDVYFPATGKETETINFNTKTSESNQYAGKEQKKLITVFYAYPLDFFNRNASDEDIVAAYKAAPDMLAGMPILRLTPEELAERINDDMFNDQEYYLRAIKEEDDATNAEVPENHKDNLTSYSKIEKLRRSIKDEIVNLMKNAGLNELTFDDELEDGVYVIWFDRHDFPMQDRISSAKMHGDEFEVICKTECSSQVSLFTNSDWGMQNIDLLHDLRDLMIFVLEETNQSKSTK